MPSILHLNLLGGLHVTLNGEPADKLATKKVQALLAYLVIHHDVPMQRSSLATLLWTEWTDSAARGNLRKSLHRLRKGLDDLQPGLSKTVLIASGKTLQINPTQISSDFIQFEQHIAAVEVHKHESLQGCDKCLSHLSSAATLYRGELLAGIQLDRATAFDEWLIQKREQLHRRALSILNKLAVAYEQRNDPQQAHHFAGRQIALEPWRESAHMQMMRAYEQMGQPEQALKQFEICRRILKDELSIEPSKELYALRDRMRYDRNGTALEQAIKPQAEAAQGHNLPLDVVFFGRTSQQQSLKRLLQSDTRWVTLLGTSGTGKTQLAQAVGHQLIPHFEQGVWFISLASLRESAKLQTQIAAAAADAIGLTLEGPDAADVQLATWLQGRHTLLIFDKFEHLLSGADIVHTLLVQCPQLSVLCTSREPLEFRAEHLFSLGDWPEAA